MADNPAETPGAGASGPEAGRQSTAAELRLRLPKAPPAYLRAALGNPALGQEELLLLLRNRQAPGELVEQVVRTPWFARYEVKRALALHPRTPLHVLRNLVPHLHWRELCELTTAPQAPPVARRQAERLLEVRVQEMTLGQRIAFARRAGRGSLGPLIGCGQSPVLEALLSNPRLVEMDVVRVVSHPATPAALLARLAEHYRWSGLRSVRLAVVRNPRTPVALALRLMQGLASPDLRGLPRDHRVPRIVRVAAERRLAGSRGPSGPVARDLRESVILLRSAARER